jgi:hypothetical protein
MKRDRTGWPNHDIEGWDLFSKTTRRKGQQDLQLYIDIDIGSLNTVKYWFRKVQMHVPNLWFSFYNKKKIHELERMEDSTRSQRNIERCEAITSQQIGMYYF